MNWSRLDFSDLILLRFNSLLQSYDCAFKFMHCVTALLMVYFQVFVLLLQIFVLFRVTAATGVFSIFRLLKIVLQLFYPFLKLFLNLLVVCLLVTQLFFQFDNYFIQLIDLRLVSR